MCYDPHMTIYDQSIWRAVADPVRARMLELLDSGPMTTGELAGRLGISRFAAMRHLEELDRAGMLAVQRRGRARSNALSDAALAFLRDWRAYADTREWSWPEWPAGPDGRTAQAQGGQAWESELAISLEFAIAAPPERIFVALTEELDAWWGSSYLTAGADAMVIEPWVGGRMYETFGDRGGALWAWVTAVERDRLLRLDGPMGLPQPVSGSANITIRADETRPGGSIVGATHRALGRLFPGMSASHRQGWTDLLDVRLRAWVEKGTRLGFGSEAQPSRP